MSLIKMPHIDECKITGGFDDGKQKTYVELTYEGIVIREYVPDNPDKKIMNLVVSRARIRLTVALKAKAARDKSKRLLKVVT